jgi:hypothetical protein
MNSDINGNGGAAPVAVAPSTGTGPVLHISPMGNLANHAIQFMAAMALAARLPPNAGTIRYSAVGLPLFGIHHPPIGAGGEATEIVTASIVPLDRLARALTEKTLRRVDLRTYAQRMENFLPPEAYRPILRPAGPAGLAWAGTGPEELLCNIRQGDILDGHHPDYVLLPIEFYADLIAETGLSPVFMGQLEDSPYLRALRARLPTARFLSSRGPAADFARILHARNIVPAISTFSWLAAWLSHAQRVFFPVLGLFNPAQNRAVDLLPLDDSRYRFYHFPIHYASGVEHFAASHAALRGLWRHLPATRLRALLARTPPPRDKALYLEQFDEAFYRAAYPDIAAAIAAGHLPHGRHHYETCGFDEGRAGFALDRAWYCAAYPIAALEIAQGHAQDPDHHWLELGRARAYTRGPAAPALATNTSRRVD